MIGLDTNILVRHFVQDDPIQSQKVAELFERGLTNENPGFVNVVTIAETVWVLRRAYGLTASEVAEGLESLLQMEVLVIDHEQEVFTAMIALKKGQGSFADVLVGALSSKAGCSHSLTFDRKASRLPNFSLL